MTGEIHGNKVMSGTVELKAIDRTGALKKIVDNIRKMAVYVGIPEENGSRKGETVTNAELAFIHTHGTRRKAMREEMQGEMDKGATYSDAHAMYLQAHGSPLMAIPPRPIIEPAIEAEGNKESIAEELGAAAKAVMDGKPDAGLTHLKRAGQTGANAARGWFDDPRNGWPENAPETIKAKGSDKPLVDTGELRKSITFVVKEG